MVTAFAVNQVIAAVHATTSHIFTEAVPLNGNDRGYAILNVHYIFGGATSRQLTCLPQVSNDGLNWVDGAQFVATTAVQSDAGPHSLYAAYLRFKFSYQVVGNAVKTDRAASASRIRSRRRRRHRTPKGSAQ